MYFLSLCIDASMYSSMQDNLQPDCFLMLPPLLLAAEIKLCSFLCTPWVFVLMHLCTLQCRRVVYLIVFLYCQSCYWLLRLIFLLFYVFLQTLYWWIYVLFNAGESSTWLFSYVANAVTWCIYVLFWMYFLSLCIDTSMYSSMLENLQPDCFLMLPMLLLAAVINLCSFLCIPWVFVLMFLSHGLPLRGEK